MSSASCCRAPRVLLPVEIVLHASLHAALSTRGAVLAACQHLLVRDEVSRVHVPVASRHVHVVRYGLHLKQREKWRPLRRTFVWVCSLAHVPLACGQATLLHVEQYFVYSTDSTYKQA